MLRKQVRIDRSKLYAEVWAEPVTQVAARYGISDVGLRKVCLRLDVPLPPLGHWAKKRAGKPVRQTPLPESSEHATYVSVRILADDTGEAQGTIDEPDEVVRQRAFEAQPENAITVRTDLLRSHPWVSTTHARLRKPFISPPQGLATPRGGPSLALAVSVGQIPRGLRIWNAILRASEVRGFKLVAVRRFGLPEAYQDLVIEVLDEPMYLSIDERTRRTERIQTPQDDRDISSGTHRSISYRYDYEPTGNFKLTVRKEIRGYALVQLLDKPNRPLEMQLNELMVNLVALAVARKAARAEDEERKRKAALEEAARYQRQLRREQALKTLHTIESLAERWERAERLRAFASALEIDVSDKSPAHRNHRGAQIAWIRSRADWLDPLVGSPWEEVDVPDFSYRHSDWMTRYTQHESIQIDDVLATEGRAESNKCGE